MLSGGVVANVKLNQRLREIPGVERIFIHPNMGDGGCGTGAALSSSWATRTARADARRLPGAELYRRRRSSEALKRAQLPFKRYTPIEPKIAALIAAGKVVARFDGRMEYGPRALGNRSILYHAREPEVNQWLNQRLGRTEFMPFAPATLIEHRRRVLPNVERRRARGAVHDDHVRLHARDEGDVAGRGARRRHRAAATRDARRRIRASTGS